MAVLDEITISIEGLVERVGPAVVGLGRGWGRGSGVVTAPGQVVTNAHNLRGEAVTVSFGDGRTEPGSVAGLDLDGDVAVVTVDTGDVEPVEWAAEGETVGIGKAVFALANPGGRGLRATFGLVSSAGRSFRGPRGRRIRGSIEHTAPLPRGSSGGPLVDADGRLLGLNAVRMDGGLILALPADAALRERVESLGRGETSEPARLGVAIAPPRVARRLQRAVGLPERDGLLVHAVEEGGPADRAGIEKGDLIVAAGDREVGRLDDMHQALDSMRGGGDLELKLVRGADERMVTVSFAVVV
jgi:S1-C subfamily serine protease